MVSCRAGVVRGCGSISSGPISVIRRHLTPATQIAFEVTTRNVCTAQSLVTAIATIINEVAELGFHNAATIRTSTENKIQRLQITSYV